MKQEMKDDMGETKEQSDFVASCILALEGAQKYIKNFGFLAGYMAQKSEFAFSDAQRENLKTVMVLWITWLLIGETLWAKIHSYGHVLLAESFYLTMRVLN